MRVTNAQRQLSLDVKMYSKGKTFGREVFCKFCFACYHRMKCIAHPKARSEGMLCVKAKNRMKGEKK